MCGPAEARWYPQDTSVVNLGPGSIGTYILILCNIKNMGAEIQFNKVSSFYLQQVKLINE